MAELVPVPSGGVGAMGVEWDASEWPQALHFKGFDHRGRKFLQLQASLSSSNSLHGVGIGCEKTEEEKECGVRRGEKRQGKKSNGGGGKRDEGERKGEWGGGERGRGFLSATQQVHGFQPSQVTDLAVVTYISPPLLEQTVYHVSRPPYGYTNSPHTPCNTGSASRAVYLKIPVHTTRVFLLSRANVS